jgi:hypothetical protein
VRGFPAETAPRLAPLGRESVELNADEEVSAMSRIADEQRGNGQGRSDDRLAERREALRRAVSDLGDVTTRFRTRLADAGHEVPPPPARNGATPLSPVRPVPDAAPSATARPVPAPAPPGGGGASHARDAAMAEARTRFEAASRQADELVRTISEAVRSESVALRADIEAGAEARFRGIEIEAQRRMRRAQAEAEALVEQRRRRIAEVSDRILELGETLAGRLADADEVKGQFDVFVQALGQASDRLAQESAATAPRSAGASVSDLGPRRADGLDAGLAEAA